MSYESQILESLAFSCLFNNMVEFQSSHLERLYMDLERPYEGKMAFQEMLNRLSFLRTSDPSVEQSKRTYHFIHLTFQEYFAARYFVRKWESPQNLQNLQ
jgi:predicted NACHT family NTPase